MCYITCVKSKRKEGKMFDRNRLRAQMVLYGVTTAELANALDIDVSTFYRKLKNNGQFTREEIATMIKVLKIDNPSEIFFTNELA